MMIGVSLQQGVCHETRRLHRDNDYRVLGHARQRSPSCRGEPADDARMVGQSSRWRLRCFLDCGFEPGPICGVIDIRRHNLQTGFLRVETGSPFFAGRAAMHSLRCERARARATVFLCERLHIMPGAGSSTAGVDVGLPCGARGLVRDRARQTTQVGRHAHAVVRPGRCRPR